MRSTRKQNYKRKMKTRRRGKNKKIKKSKRNQETKPIDMTFKNVQCSPNPGKQKDYT